MQTRCGLLHMTVSRLNSHRLTRHTQHCASSRLAAVVRPRVRRRRLQLSAAAVYDLNRVSSSNNWRGLDAFDADLQPSELFQAPPLDPETAFRCYDQTLRHILDQHAPLITKRVSLGQSVAWYDSECRAMKRTTRRLERQYRRQRSADSLIA